MGEILPWEEKALEELNDVPELREERLKQFAEKLAELQSDDFRPLLQRDFLMMFLRTRKFDVARALKSYVAAFSMHKADPTVFWPKGKGPADYRLVLELPICKVMPKKNSDGTTVIVCTYLRYTSDLFSILDVITVSTMICAHLLRDPYIQTYGVTCVFDYRNLQVKHLRSIPIKYYKAVAIAVRDGCPARLRGFHHVFAPTFMSLMFYALRPLLNRKLSSRTHFHSKVADLHQLVCTEALPDELGGTAGKMAPGAFEEDLLASHDEYVRSSYYGFS
ncbi:alpha-tocopherol transfer protein-like [Galendromus occidentalis]|uniref:Alpha-tocopherol transfer protein-like n=1 Tax=Galendromus occidentalis TaxID=34638 RepID=A0AAJ6QXD6_9ACAR|nr:alpha-tocopherol transfer protein-like [Galendromus occidentalis]